MTYVTLYALSGTVLFGIGFQGTVFCRELVRKVIAINVMSAGVFLVLIALAARTPVGPPDPVPQAMVLTGIVVAVSATALTLALIRRLHRETGLTRLPDRDDK
jgi:multicomponent Na+:H+ antiporter subunit C